MSKIASYQDSSKGGSRQGQIIGEKTLKKAALRGFAAELIETLQIKARFKGHQAIPKDQIKRWKRIVKAGFAREGNTHIHLINNSELQEGTLIPVQPWLLQAKPMEAAYFIIQAYLLRAQALRGKKRHARMRNIRLVCKQDCGGVCLDMMAEYFGRTRQWASFMRRAMEKHGWCTYKRRFERVAKTEMAAARLANVPDSGRYLPNGGLTVREYTSKCSLMKDIIFRQERMEYHA